MTEEEREKAKEERQKWVLDRINDEMKKVNRDLEEYAKKENLSNEQYLQLLMDKAWEPK